MIKETYEFNIFQEEENIVSVRCKGTTNTFNHVCISMQSTVTTYLKHILVKIYLWLSI